MKTSETADRTDSTPLLLRRIENRPVATHPLASHFTMVTTQGNQPEMGDQSEDNTRYDSD
ncbi:MAG: hypothetical protein UW28_C0044G0003 [Parcubacteria group bacterium GW2011_GWA2_44_13]|uniref:Uncharacterized protein n=2 Tax=Candidatus Tayloriibacteriota TaxID=1817919 RepID=A0A1G2PAL9_9BACT|nr:MAG: hypothetical protein UW28_C0044G0003 [Parcubacteria group bacterium GW2011_GWA2_44_13]OHA41681.1 MAG: hypothetical protein A3H68_01820 [Candidatus Taylorbacteria bacterium RIFCSPLOWO2_02_FULL_46_40]OHA44682.1 MAG: hypothetical protein A3G59_03760 [Candidatus Taylorbacteria bacterium RIFCSPLOWO2_12_FULL_47_20]